MSTVLNINKESVKAAASLLEHFEDQINAADTKAQLTIGVNTLLAAAITLTNKGITPTFPTGPITLRDVLVTFTSFLLLGGLIVSVYFALLCTRPTLTVKQQRARTLFYFGDIVSYTEEAFIQTFRTQSMDDVERAMLSQVYAKSVIAKKKFVRIQRAINVLFGSLILWAALKLALILIP